MILKNLGSKLLLINFKVFIKLNKIKLKDNATAQKDVYGREEQ